MKTKHILLILGTFAALAFSGPNKLVNKRMPYFEGTTISGMKVDSSFFRNKVTLISFMYIGCPPCMREIRQLNKLKKENTHPDFQILGICAGTAQQLADFNSDNATIYSQARKKAKVDSLEYFLLPECASEKEKKTPNTLGPECYVISKLFKVFAYPTSFLIDKKGKVRYAFSGYVTEQDEEAYIKELKAEIASLLAD